LFSSIESPNELYPTDFAIKKVYPNPFNSFTTILINLDKSQNINLCLYNVSGEKVADLINQNYEAGETQIPLNLDYLASGVYLLRLTGQHYVSSKKIVLMK
jgi:hypothetical protein